MVPETAITVMTEKVRRPWTCRYAVALRAQTAKHADRADLPGSTRGRRIETPIAGCERRIREVRSRAPRRVSAPGIHPDSPGGARPAPWRLPAAVLGWPRRSGRAGGRLELLEPRPPAIGAAAQPFEDPGQLGRDRGFAFAKEPAGVVDQQQIASQREAFEHPSRAESSRRRSSIGQSQIESSRPADALGRPRCLAAAACRSSVRPWAFTCSTRVETEVCGLASGVSAMPAATGFRSM